MTSWRKAEPGEVFFDLPAVEREMTRTPYFDVNLRGGFYTIEPSLRAALVLPVIPGRGVVLVRVRRPLLQDCPLEVPGGGVAPDETAAQAARRELAEETGIHIHDLDRFREWAPLCEDPSRFTRFAHVLTVDITPEEFAGRGPSDEEIEDVVFMDFPSLAQACADGSIYVMGALAVLSRVMLMRGRGFDTPDRVCEKP